MPKGTTYCNDLLGLLFRAAAIANIADNAASSPLTNLYLSLHTADPGAGGNQQTSEATFGAYARIAVARSAGGWNAPSGGILDNAALIQFAECTSGSNVITHVGIGTLASGTGKLLYVGALAASRTISSGIRPQFAASALTVTEA